MPNCSAPKLYWPGQSTAFGGCLLFELSVLSIYRLHRKHVLITYVSKHKLGSTGAIAHGRRSLYTWHYMTLHSYHIPYLFFYLVHYITIHTYIYKKTPATKSRLLIETDLELIETNQ